MKSKVIVLLCVFIVLFSCSNHEQITDATGVFEVTEVIVSAETSGRLNELLVDEGQTLTVEQPIANIDVRQLILKHNQLLSNKTAIGSRTQNVVQQVAALKEQIATQQHELQRFKGLVSNKAANQKQVDDINAQIKILEKQLSAQKANLENANAGVKADGKSVLFQIEQIDDQIQRAHIIAPISGTVLNKYAEVGEYVAPGKAIVKLGDLSKMKLRAYVQSPQLTKIKIGQLVKVFVDMDETESREYKGVVTWISDKSEFTPKTIQTRDERTNLVYAIKISVNNDGYIKRGMYGEVKF